MFLAFAFPFLASLDSRYARAGEVARPQLINQKLNSEFPFSDLRANSELRSGPDMPPRSPVTFSIRATRHYSPVSSEHPQCPPTGFIVFVSYGRREGSRQPLQDKDVSP